MGVEPITAGNIDTAARYIYTCMRLVVDKQYIMKYLVSVQRLSILTISILIPLTLSVSIAEVNSSL